MLKRFRAGHPILYCIFAEVAFLVVLQLGGLLELLAILFYRVTGLGWGFVTDDYAMDALGQLPSILFGIFLLYRTGEQKLITRRGCGFLNGMLVGMGLFAIIGYDLTLRLFFSQENGEMRSPLQLFWFAVSMLFIGIAEEFLARGVVAETLLEHFGTSRKGVWEACLLSGCIFGAGHLINVFVSAPLGVLVQCIFAAFLGAFLAAVYFRTGNLWVTVFLHALMDFSSLWESGAYGTHSAAEAISGYSIQQLRGALLYILPLFFLLRKKKIGEVELYFGQDCKKE